jgi:glyoxylase I family protein
MANNRILGDGGIHHVALRVRDFEVSIKFYESVLGFVEKVRWNETPKRVVLLDTGNGSYLELFENGQNAPKPEDAFWHLAFRVKDAAAMLEHCRRAGCEVWMEPKTLSNLGGKGIEAKVAFCKGPDGELLEFFESDGL